MTALSIKYDIDYCASKQRVNEENRKLVDHTNNFEGNMLLETKKKYFDYYC